VILTAGDVVDLQFFLMDGAKRYAHASVVDADMMGDLLASAAALDYALYLASERADEPIDDVAPIAGSVRETMTRASLAALGLIARLVRAPDETFLDFAGRHARAGGIFDVIASLRKGDVVLAGDVAFEVLTVTSDLVDRRLGRGRGR